jgi:hypothetical protein
MNNPYQDIRNKLGYPIWWDEHAVPRYCAFTPEEFADIYAREGCLLEIACQNCGRRFKVAMSSSVFDQLDLSLRVKYNTIHYGDPPNVGCCAAGPTMNSVPLRVLRFYRREPKRDRWQRVPELEKDVACEWVQEWLDEEAEWQET